MADTTAIEWTDATWQVSSGCTPASEGCRNCYSARLCGTRMKHHPRTTGLVRQATDGRYVFTGEVRCHEDQLAIPLNWRQGRRIFVGDRTDIFHPDVPDTYLDQIFAIMTLCPHHTFQLLTKRPERMMEYMTAVHGHGRSICSAAAEITSARDGTMAGGLVSAAAIQNGLPNLWMGVSVENQTAADIRIRHLLATPAAVRFLSCEPLLGPMDLTWHGISDDVEDRRISWVICGGESGAKARPMHPDWVRGLRDQCAAAKVPFFFKQWGEFLPITADDTGEGLMFYPDDGGPTGRLEGMTSTSIKEHGREFARVGKKAAGRLLDGFEHSALPEAWR